MHACVVSRTPTSHPLPSPLNPFFKKVLLEDVNKSKQKKQSLLEKITQQANRFSRHPAPSKGFWGRWFNPSSPAPPSQKGEDVFCPSKRVREEKEENRRVAVISSPEKDRRRSTLTRTAEEAVAKCSAHRTAKTRLIKWKDSPLFYGTQTDQNHTKQQKNVKFKKKGFAQLLLPHTTPTKYYKKKSSSPFPLSGNHFPSAEWFAPGCASTKLCYKRIVLVRVSIVNRRRLRNHT